MFSILGGVLKGLLASKKFVAMIVGLIVIIVGKLGLNLDPEAVTKVVGLIMAYIVGQGIADNGKEAAKVEAGVTKEGTQP